MVDLKVLRDRCEELLRAGQIEIVCRELSDLNPTQIPRPLCLPFANIARRAGLIALGLKTLRPLIVWGPGNAISQATAQEVAEYGVLLQKSGAVQDALRALTQVKESEVADVLLYRTFCHFSRWEYPTAIPLLESYIREERRLYNRLVGRVNLASALIEVGRHKDALAQIEDNIAAIRSGNFTRLEANCLELRAQVKYHENDFKGARADLSDAAARLGDSRTHDLFSIRKWAAIVEATECQDPTPLVRIRVEAVNRRHWESVREMDRFLLRVRFEPELFVRLYFGTPHAFYRERLTAEFSEQTLPDHCILGFDGAKIMDLVTGQIKGTAEIPPSAIHRLIGAMTKDFYRPNSLGGLFSDLFPREHFDIFSSPNRLHQLIFRTRHWLSANGVAASLVELDGSYTFIPGPGFGLRVPFERGDIPDSVGSRHLIELQMAFGTNQFSCRQACQILGISATSFKAMMADATAAGKTVRSGRGPATVYKFLATDDLSPLSTRKVQVA